MDRIIDHLNLTFVAEKTPPSHGFAQVALIAAEERQREELDDKAEEESEPAQPITTCQRCGANDKPPDYKIFGYKPPTLKNCQKCGRLVCDGCLISVYDPSYEYDIVCRECYEAKEQEDAKKREEYWREEEENKLED